MADEFYISAGIGPIDNSTGATPNSYYLGAGVTPNDVVTAFAMACLTALFNLTGKPSDLKAGYKIPNAVGAFSLTGINNDLHYLTIGAFAIYTDTGYFALTGNSANLQDDARLVVAILDMYGALHIKCGLFSH